MAFRLSPKFKRNISRIIPFAVIWLVVSWVLLLAETVASNNQNLSPGEAVTLTLPVFTFASIAIAVVGLMVGTLEMVVLENAFSRYSLARKIAYKLCLYLLFLIVINFLTYPVAASLELGVSPFNVQVWEKFQRYLLSMTFVNTLVQLGFSVLLSLLYVAISQNLGHQVLINFFTGKYHQPLIENRIFMFLDMKSSTTIAEQLGHVQYFALLKRYYATMSDPIINHFGEVYQYIGDEVVITWKVTAGSNPSDSLCCFFSIQEAMAAKRESFERDFGVFPEFKAGLHVGEVTSGEIGALKKEIAYTGDVLNTAARIQGMCKRYGEDLIISQDLQKLISKNSPFTLEELGTIALKGKVNDSQLFAVSKKMDEFTNQANQGSFHKNH
ncbi:MAG: adenylate/guanylate cyclase domain-containing protein [Bacteroidota bacterium]